LFIENLKSHYHLVKDQGYQKDTCLAIIQSSKDFLKPLKIDEFIMLYPLDYINTQFDVDDEDSKFLTAFIRRIEFYKQIEGKFGHHYYILEYKFIKLGQSKVKQIVSGFSIQDILEDLLNILTLYYNRYFILFPFNVFSMFETSEKYKEKIKVNDKNYDDVEVSSSNVTKNFNILCQLRQEQFYLIQKSMKLYSNSLYAYETNPTIALCLLISSIEVLAQKYVEFGENWEDYSNLSFYNGLKKDLRKISDDDLRNELFAKIGKRYIKEAFLVKARFKDFILKYCDDNFHLIEDSDDSLFKELINEYYELRSLYMHTGKEILTSNFNRAIIFNKTSSGKLKTYEEGSKLDIRVLPSFQVFIKVIKSSILKFIDFLYSHRKDEEDKQHYTALDFKPRNVIEVVSKTDVMPGSPVMGSQIHMKEQYIHLYERNEKINKYLASQDFKGLIAEYSRIKEKIKDSSDFRRIALINDLLGSYYLLNGEFDQALPSLLEAKKICTQQAFQDIEPNVDYNLACYYSLKNDLDQARAYFKRAVKVRYLKELAKGDPHLDNLMAQSDMKELLK